MRDTANHKSVWTIHKYYNDDDYKANRPYEVSTFEGNILLNEGIDELEKLACGLSATAYSNANARLGVGDSDTAENANQTGLQAATNKTWKGMDTGYPTVSSQVMTFKSTFGSGDANYAWKEFTVVNASDDSGKNLNRKVSNQGTKASGQTWTLTLTITLS